MLIIVSSGYDLTYSLHFFAPNINIRTTSLYIYSSTNGAQIAHVV